MAGSLSVANTAVLSTNVDVVDSGEVGRFVVYKRYNNGPRVFSTACDSASVTSVMSKWAVSSAGETGNSQGPSQKNRVNGGQQSCFFVKNP
jgi:hypothetical protein